MLYGLLATVLWLVHLLLCLQIKIHLLYMNKSKKNETIRVFQLVTSSCFVLAARRH